MFTKIYTFDELKRINDGRTAISGHHYIDIWGNIYIGTDYRKLKSYSSSTAVWGNITGDIADQVDLMSLLGTKVESVTGLNTDNTDPLNPVVQISVDGVTITGDGTPGSPLMAIISGLVDSVTDDGNGVVSVDNTDPQNPIINFNGVNVDGVTISGDGTFGNPLSVITGTGTGLYIFMTGGNQSTTSATATAITDLITPTLEANSRYMLYAYIHIGCNNTGGVNFAFDIPTAASVYVSVHGRSTSNGAYRQVPMLTDATLTGLTWNALNNANGGVILGGEIATGANSGTAQLMFAAGTAGQTATIYQLGTFIFIKKIA